ncbi:hypothetical protein BOTBODRAFT_204784, partial [Botryobasidium botryosum FD-172 SS1]
MARSYLSNKSSRRRMGAVVPATAKRTCSCPCKGWVTARTEFRHRLKHGNASKIQEKAQAHLQRVYRPQLLQHTQVSHSSIASNASNEHQKAPEPTYTAANDSSSGEDMQPDDDSESDSDGYSDSELLNGHTFAGDLFSPVHMFSEIDLRAARARCRTMTDDEWIHMKAFSLQHRIRLSDENYKMLREELDELSFPPRKVLRRRIERLSGLSPQLIDCCVNSCTAFTGDFEACTACPYCGEDRYHSDGESARNHFQYLPLKPRLRALSGGSVSARRIRHRAEEHVHFPGVIADVFDTQHYRHLCTKHPIVHGEVLPHRYFDDPRDVALGLFADGFRLFKRGNHSACDSDP